MKSSVPLAEREKRRTKRPDETHGIKKERKKEKKRRRKNGLCVFRKKDENLIEKSRQKCITTRRKRKKRKKKGEKKMGKETANDIRTYAESMGIFVCRWKAHNTTAETTL